MKREPIEPMGRFITKESIAELQEIQEFTKHVGLYPRERTQPVVRQGKKIGRNDPCPCGSGKKYKKCCG
jgi:preprotein translocase subunit SecA